MNKQHQQRLLVLFRQVTTITFLLDSYKRVGNVLHEFLGLGGGGLLYHIDPFFYTQYQLNFCINENYYI